jgi:O-antigen ligase
MHISGAFPVHQAHPLGGIRLLGALFAATSVLAVLIASQAWLYLAALVAVPLSLFWPVEVGLGVFAALVPFSIVGVGKGDAAMKLGWIAGLGAGAALLFHGLILGRLQRPPAAARYWILLVVWSGFTAFWALDRAESLQTLVTAISLLLLYVIAVSVRISEKQFAYVCIMVLLGGSAAAAIGAKYALQHISGARLFGITGTKQDDPNMFAASLLLPLALAFAISVRQRSWFPRVLALLAASVIVLGIFFTMSRGGLLAMTAMFGVFAYRLRLSRRLILLVSLVLILLPFMPGLLLQRIHQAEAGDPRLAVWRVGLVLVRHYGLIGVGLSNFPVAFTQFASEARGLPEEERYGHDSHNIYLGTTVEFGLIGLALLGAAITSQLKGLKSLHRRSGFELTWQLLGIEAATWGLLVAGFFVNLFWFKFFWLDWMLLAQAIRIAERKFTQNGANWMAQSRWQAPVLGSRFTANTTSQ